MPEEQISEETTHPGSKVVLDAKRLADSVLGKLTIHGREIPIPSFIHEISGGEDFSTTVKHQNLLSEPHIIAAPAYNWESITQVIPPAHKELYQKSLDLIAKHHIMLYEPPEYYRFIMPQRLVTHALRRDISKARKFYRLAVIDGEKNDALSLLPSFEREFISNQWDTLLWQRYLAMKSRNAPTLKKIKNLPKKPDSYPKIESAWFNVKKSYIEHALIGLLEARRLPSASFVPAVRTLKASSDANVRKTVKSQNNALAFLWRERLKGSHFRSGRPWFHLSVDKTVFERNGDTTTDHLLGIVNSSLEPTIHCGVCLTMTGWQDAWADGKPRRRLESFIRNLADSCFIEKIPLYGARSKWIGLDLTDLGLTFAGSILNGSETLAKSGGGFSKKDPKVFGKIPIYGECREVKINDLFKEGKNPGEYRNPIKLHNFTGIPDSCNPSLQSDSERFRMEFSKPRRIATHTQEVREIRKELNKERGSIRPGREYIKKSSLWKGIRQ